MPSAEIHRNEFSKIASSDMHILQCFEDIGGIDTHIYDNYTFRCVFNSTENVNKNVIYHEKQQCYRNVNRAFILTIFASKVLKLKEQHVSLQ